MICTAFQVTEDDVESVLHSYTLRIANSRGMSIAALASEVFHEIDAKRVEKAALNSSGDLVEQANGALAEIKDILCEIGVLEF
ncbi:hypothetical protein GIW05_00445 [Pseudomonas syringae]|uniref:hypothetical protein n=1 Tax=Pseudomonas syringae TaxID=317 RepID=UPI001F4639BB|nr:hypothetical protein [Pseudomonas syringae]MCF5381991.1 hypothetical protein [Pseudomonas syringae]MCF5419476.1 hypothetical protein [Pseudomonas syringae]MCF5452022.1 hypothetical protein [Pseudomonas syringae]MCF5456309.1 hypothetical protein [Pseudomonas syringae]